MYTYILINEMKMLKVVSTHLISRVAYFIAFETMSPKFIYSYGTCACGCASTSRQTGRYAPKK